MIEDQETGDARAAYLVEPEGNCWKVSSRPAGSDGPFVERGLSVSMEGALKVVADSASGASSLRAAAFQRGLDHLIAAVDPQVAASMEGAWFKPHHTGGGCMAWRRDVDGEEGSYVLVTHGDGSLDGEAERDWCVGRYDGDDGAYTVVHDVSLSEAIRIAAILPTAHGEVGIGVDDEAFEDAGPVEPTEPRWRAGRMVAGGEVAIVGLTLDEALEAAQEIVDDREPRLHEGMAAYRATKEVPGP